MDSGFIQQSRNYTQYRNLPVLQCRVGVHSLGPQDNEKSENHLTIYLLVGSNRSVRVDMVPSQRLPYSDLLGTLVLRGHDYSLSDGIIKHVDINAVGCPADFNPVTSQVRASGSRSVQDFTSIVQQLPIFRFMDIDGKSVGCRSWVYG